MNKKLLAVAVAGALAAPGVALAQVTISGIFKVGIDQYSISGDTAGRSNKSEMRITDNSSRVILTVNEDLGGGLAAVGQWDIRGPMDSASSFANSGNTFVGLRSNSLGTVALGRFDLHYGSQPDDIASKAGALMAASISLMDYGGTGLIPIANATRTPNVVKWDSPTWGGFNLIAAYSTTGQAQPTGAGQAQEADLTLGTASTSKGSSYNLKGQFTAANWQVGGSLWNSKADGTIAANETEVNSTVGWGYIRFGGFKVGAAMNEAGIKVGGSDVSKRTAWTIPASYTAGAHNFYAHYTVADSDSTLKDLGINDTGAKMYAFAYVYDLSKRTSVGITYAKIDNNINASYNFFTNTGGLGSVNSTMVGGEDGQLIAGTLRQSF
jgi:predicted porin